MFVHLLSKRGVENPNYRSEKVKRRIRAHFGSRIVFYQPQERAADCIVHAADFPPMQLAQLLKSNESEDSCEDTESSQEPMSQSSGCVDSTDDCDIQAAARSGEALHEVYHVAMLLRQCISRLDSTPWPPVIDDLTEESIVIPNILYNFLCG